MPEASFEERIDDADGGRFFTIAPGLPFLDTLAAALLAGRIIPGWPDPKDPLALSEATIFVPTRRAARALSERIAARSGGGAVLLPRILPLGGIDEAENRLLFEMGSGGFGGEPGLPPEIDPVRRRLVLARLVTAWSARIDATLASDAEALFDGRLQEGLRSDANGFVVAASPRDALQLADALGQLIDTLAIHDKTWKDLHDLVPEALADAYWSISKDFLTIAAEAWPAYCADHGVMDAARRRHRLILGEAERLRRAPPKGPVIAAGSTGSMPATAKLIAAIAQLERGAVILPGLDRVLDPAAFGLLLDGRGALIHPTHPQGQMARLLHEAGIGRDAVQSLGTEEPALAARTAFLSEAMVPTEATDRWKTRAERLDEPQLAAALAGVALAEAAHEREEALAIALALREALETPGRTAALITPDRPLAERVAQELQRWGIAVEDSAGRALARSEAGTLAGLVAGVAADDFAPWSLLALLAHPLACFGLDDEVRARGRRALDLGVMRAPLPGPGLEGLRATLEAAMGKDDRRRPAPMKRLDAADWAAALRLIDRIATVFAPFMAASRDDLLALARRHEAVIRAVAATPDDPDAFDAVEGAEAISDLFAAALPHEDRRIEGRFADYPGFFDSLMAGKTLSRRGDTHRRIRIWGLLEARLLTVDLAVLGGLDETVWPPDTRTDPFLNRPWRNALTLPAPERRIGQTAHDLVGAMGAREVLLTRSAKRGGTPTVPSRFLQRMKALAGEAALRPVIARGERFLDLARRIDASPAPRPVAQPRPVATREQLPVSLSVTEIETLRRDPYSIYAKHVLCLDPLDPVGRVIGASDLGSIIHTALERFGEACPTGMPPDALEKLLTFGREAYRPVKDHPEYAAFWWPAFERIAHWFVGWERTWRAAAPARIALERSGKLAFDLPGGGSFTLRGKADRIEIRPDGTIIVIDYKTGSPPSAKQVKVGFSPQLTLEAAMVKGGGFEGLSGARVGALVYLKLGGKDGGEEKPVRDSRAPFDVDALADAHLAALIELIDSHWNGGRPFASQPIPEFMNRYGRYDHLARVREWSLTGDGTGEGGEE